MGHIHKALEVTFLLWCTARTSDDREEDSFKYSPGSIEQQLNVEFTIADFFAKYMLIEFIFRMMIARYKEWNYKSTIRQQETYLNVMLENCGQRHWTKHDKLILSLSCFTLKMTGFKDLKPSVVCQTIKNTLLSHGIPYEETSKGDKSLISIDADVNISKKKAKAINYHIRSSLERLNAIPKLQKTLDSLSHALHGYTQYYTAIPGKDVDGLPVKKFIFSIPQSCVEIFDDEQRLKNIFSSCHIQFTGSALIINGYMLDQGKEWTKFIGEIQSVVKNYKIKSAQTAVITHEKNSVIIDSPETSTSVFPIKSKKSNYFSETKEADKSLPRPSESVPVIKWKSGSVFNPATYDPTKRNNVIPYRPGMYFKVAGVHSDVRDLMERGKAIGQHGQGVRFFNAQTRDQWGPGIIGDLKFKGKDGRGEKRAFLGGETSPTGEVLLDVVSIGKKKH